MRPCGGMRNSAPSAGGIDAFGGDGNFGRGIAFVDDVDGDEDLSVRFAAGIDVGDGEIGEAAVVRLTQSSKNHLRSRPPQFASRRCS